MPNWALLLTDTGRSISVRPFNPVALVLLIGPLVLLRRRGKSAGYLLCFSLFFLYLWAVCNYAVCPLPIDPDLVEWMSTVQKWDERINLRPDLFARLDEYWYSPRFYDNILMGIPFGLGLPFVVAAKNRTARRAIAICFGFGAGLELIQLGISLVFYGFPYRSIDIEDVVLVFLGALSGYVLFRVVALLYGLLGWGGGARMPIWEHFHGVLRSVAAAPVDGAAASQEAPEPAGEGNSSVDLAGMRRMS